MTNLLEGRVVVIVGGAGRLGRTFTTAVAESGGIPVVADLDAEAVAAIARDVSSSLNCRVEPATVDVADPAAVTALVDDVSRRLGSIDAVVCTVYPKSANYGRKFEDVSYHDFCEHLGLHVGGYFTVAQQFGAFFRRQGHGHIVNIASVYGVLAPRFELYEGTAMTVPVEYAASKAAIVHLTKYLARYFKGCNIRINTITPGGILDDQPEQFVARYRAHCLGKGMLDARDLSGTLLFLLSDMSAYLNGQNLTVDDGFTL